MYFQWFLTEDYKGNGRFHCFLEDQQLLFGLWRVFFVMSVMVQTK